MLWQGGWYPDILYRRRYASSDVELYSGGDISGDMGHCTPPS